MKTLRVWWIPQIPMRPFLVTVSSVEEGVRVMDILADYDLFQFQNNVKPDYSNAGGLHMYEEGEGWVDWYDEETGEDDPRAYLAALEDQ